MKTRVLLSLAVAMLLALSCSGFVLGAEARDFSKEQPLHNFRSHGGDRAELTDTFAALLESLDKGDGKEFIADGAVNAEQILAYFAELRELKAKLSEVSVKTELFYNVANEPVFFNYRTLAAFSYYVEGEKGEKLLRTDRLALAKLGKEATDWKVWQFLHTNAGLDVSPVELTQLDPPKAGEEIGIMETEAGVIKFRLFPEKTPKAVENFKGLAEKHFYDGLFFNRVIDNFVIQGGALDDSADVDVSFFGGPFADEFGAGLYHFRGALAFGNAGPDTNANQIYFVQNPEARETDLELCSLPLNVKEKYAEIGGLPHLDFRYTLFGQAFAGLDVIDKIVKQKTDENDMPAENPIKIISVRFEIWQP